VCSERIGWFFSSILGPNKLLRNARHRALAKKQEEWQLL